ncbi:MAG: hypothetical protein FWD36_00395 [Treponema sp.]|nr:hypothetical protein [Treponema sp.]
MNIEAVPMNTFPSIYAINASQTGRASLPVAPSAAIYAQFKHISGTPAPEGVQGVNIDKLRLIDTLIEQLAKMKKEPNPIAELSGEDEDKRLNALIEHYHNQIRQAANAQNPFAQTASLVGALFNISV